jgi:ActR/RegA family two-component response regulator
MSVLLVIQNFLGNINRAVLALLKGSAHIFADDADAEQLYAAQQQNQHDNGGIARDVDALNQLCSTTTIR